MSLKDIWINIHYGDEPPIALPANKKRMMGGFEAGGDLRLPDYITFLAKPWLILCCI